MIQESPVCLTCFHFTLSPADEQKRSELLKRTRAHAPPGMHGTCAASRLTDAHILHSGNFVPLHEIRVGRPPHETDKLENVIAQTPCRVFDSSNNPMYLSLRPKTD